MFTSYDQDLARDEDEVFMTTQKVKMSSKGQVVIPAAIRRKMELGTDSELALELEGDRIVLTPIREDEDWRDLRGCLDDVEDSAGELVERVRRRELEREGLSGGES